jgi:glycosyltransferase involved in cell wall biosynthesis
MLGERRCIQATSASRIVAVDGSSKRLDGRAPKLLSRRNKAPPIGARPDERCSGATRNVLLVSATSQLGGAELSLVDLAETLDATRWRVHVVAPPSGPLVERLRAAGIEVITCPWLVRPQRRYAPKALWEVGNALVRARRFLGSLIRARGIDLIHANTTAAALYVAAPPGSFVRWTCARSRIPVIWHVRDLRHGPEARWVSTSVDGILCVSRACQQSLPRPSRAAHVDVVPSGVALAASTSPSVMAADVAGRAARPTLVAVGHFAPWKAHDRLLQAFASVRRRGLDAVLDVLGGDPMGYHPHAREQLERQTRALGLTPFVSFHGVVPDPRPFLRRATCLVHAAYPEPFGRVVVEALSCGCPVIALAGSHGPAESLRDGVGGRLVPSFAPEALADAIVEVAGDPQLASRLAAGAEDKARRLYDRRVTTRQIERSYDAVLGRAESERALFS